MNCPTTLSPLQDANPITPTWYNGPQLGEGARSRMTRVRVMYWKEIPVQVQAVDDSSTVSKPLDHRFQEAADAIAMLDGSAGTDEYLSAWQWGQYQDADGSAAEAAQAAAERFNRRFPDDFAARIRDLHRSGTRDPSPGAIDHWVGDASN